MSETTIPGDKVKLVKFPANRGLMDWDRILHINQAGQVQQLHYDGKTDPIYLVWFSSRNGKEGWEVWLSSDQFTGINKEDNRGY